MMPSFAEPVWLWAALLLPLALLLFFRWRSQHAARRLHAFAAEGLAESLVGSVSRRRLWIRKGLAAAGLFLLCLSLARPQWGADWETSEAAGIDIMIALDTSRSMLAEDIAPNRLERSKLAILDLLETVRGDRVGLIAFAGRAFLQCPLTLDYQAFRQTLQALDTESIPVAGTDVASAIAEAEAYFERSGNQRILILITDGEDLEASGIERAREAAGKGTRILAVGVGSTEGELIPVRGPDGSLDYLRDANGDPVSTALDEATLRRIAQAANGVYAPLGPTGAGLQRVYEFSLEQTPASERQEMLQRVPIERFQWPLLLALLAFFFEALISTRKRRRSVAASAPIAGLLFLATVLGPQPAEAGPAREAADAYAEGRFEESLSLYREAVELEPEDARLHFNLGVSAYRSAAFEDSLTAFEETLRLAGNLELQRKAFYNAGNTRVAYGFALLEEEPALARDLWQAALTDYQNAIDMDPEVQAPVQNRATLVETIAAYTHDVTARAEPAEAGAVNPSAGSAFHRIPIEVSAKAAEGWEFEAWSGEGLENPEAAKTFLRPEQDTELVALFAKTWDLIVESANPAHGSAGTSGTYRADTPVPVKAEAEDYFAFSGWKTVDPLEVADPSQPETEVTLKGNGTLTATFVPAFKLSVSVDPEIGGQAGPSGFFEEYSVVPIQAQPRDGFAWKGWTGDGISDRESQQTDIALTADRVVIANMERIWNLVIVPVPEEGGQVEGAGNHPVGSTVDISATPAEGFTFAGWEGPGVADPTAASTSVTVASPEHTLFARFQQDDSEDNSEDQQDPQDQQQDQQNQQQDPDQQNQQDQQQEQGQESSPEESDPGEQPLEEEPPAEPETQEQTPENAEDEASEASGQPQTTPAELAEAMEGMTREEARQMLRALSQEEKFLPAAERNREDRQPPDNTEGRNW